MHLLPGRKLILLGDGGYASHEFACFFARHQDRITLVSRFHPDAALYAPAPTVTRKNPQGGRPRQKGRKLPTPRKAIQGSKLPNAVVAWYSATMRVVGLASGVGLWYKAGEGLVAVRWVFVQDRDGTRRDEYFYTTDVSLSPEAIVGLYMQRWSIETMFQEAKGLLGLETTRTWVKTSVLRQAPCLLGLFSVVALIFAEEWKRRPIRPLQTPWQEKPEITFSDALAAVRRLFWRQTVFAHLAQPDAFQKLPALLRRFILDSLARAA